MKKANKLSDIKTKRITNDLTELNLKKWTYIRNLTQQDYEKNSINRGGSTYGWYMCNKCNHVRYSQKGILKAQMLPCPNCDVPSPRRLTEGYNDLATKRPDLIKYLADPSDATKYTYSSARPILLKCPICGELKESKLNTLVNYGFYCACKDKPIFKDDKIKQNIFQKVLNKINEKIKQLKGLL